MDDIRILYNIIRVDDKDQFAALYESGKIDLWAVNPAYTSRMLISPLIAPTMSSITTPDDELSKMKNGYEIFCRYMPGKIMNYIFDFQSSELLKFTDLDKWIDHSRLLLLDYSLFDEIMNVRRTNGVLFLTNQEFIDILCSNRIMVDDIRYILKKYYKIKNEGYSVTVHSKEYFNILSAYNDCYNAKYVIMSLLLEHGANPNHYDFDEGYYDPVYDERIVDNINEMKQNPYANMFADVDFQKKLILHKLLYNYIKHRKGYVFINNIEYIVSMIILLIQYGADPLLRDNISNNYRNLNCINLLHSKGMKKFGEPIFITTIDNMISKSIELRNVLINDYLSHAAYYGFHLKIREYFSIVNDHSIINKKDLNNHTALYNAVQYSRSWETIRHLLDNGADPNIPDEHGETPFRLLYKNLGNNKYYDSKIYEITLDILRHNKSSLPSLLPSDIIISIKSYITTH